LRDIAAALGIRAPSLYNHLESKQALLQEIMLGTMETLIRELRRRYARPWISLIEQRVAEDRFETPSPQLAAYAMLQMGMGVSRWFRADRAFSESQVAYYYADMALPLVLARPAPRTAQPPPPMWKASHDPGGIQASTSAIQLPSAVHCCVRAVRCVRAKRATGL
jgi:AcrR family transcriptional regulator